MKRLAYPLSLIILTCLGLLILMIPYQSPVKISQVEESGDKTLLENVIVRTTVKEEKAEKENKTIQLDYILDQQQASLSVDNPLLLESERYAWDKKIRKFAPNNRPNKDSMIKIADNGQKELWLPIAIPFWLGMDNVVYYSVFDSDTQTFINKEYPIEGHKIHFQYLGHTYDQKKQVVNILLEAAPMDEEGSYRDSGKWLSLSLNLDQGDVVKFEEVERPSQNRYHDYAFLTMDLNPAFAVLSSVNETGETSSAGNPSDQWQPTYQLFNSQWQKVMDLPNKALLDYSQKHFWVVDDQVYLYETTDFPEETVSWTSQANSSGSGILYRFNPQKQSYQKIKEFGPDSEEITLVDGKIYLTQQISPTDYQLQVFDPVSEQVVYQTKWRLESLQASDPYVFLNLSVTSY